MVNTKHLTRLDIELDPMIDIGKVPLGHRRVFPIKGGTMTGELNGVVLPGGADWNLVRPDGTAVFWALYTLQTDDGVNIMIQNEGGMPGNEEDIAKMVDGDMSDVPNIYSWGTPKFEVAGEKYAFLNERIFLSTLTPKSPVSLFVDIYEVLGRST